MAYQQKDEFLLDYQAAQRQAIAKYGAFCKPVADDVAWSAYTNSAKKTDSDSSILGLMLFGRHVGSMKKEVAAIATDAFRQRQGAIQAEDERMRKSKVVLSVYRAHVTKKATAANFRQQEREKLDVPAAIDTDKANPMIKNFGVVNNNETGSILLIGDTNWNLTINDTWLLGAVHSHLPFYPASAVSRANIYENKHILSITGRELFGLAIFGYKQVIPDYPELGSAFEVSDRAKANEATLVKYQTAMDGLTELVAKKAFTDAGFRIADVGI